MKDMFPTNHWIKTHGDLALDLGIGLIVKAGYFMYHSDDLLQTMDTMGSYWFAPAILTHYIVLAHLMGGFCLLIGLFTRTAALLQLPILFGALFYVHLPQMLKSAEGQESTEFVALVLFLLALISVYGAGRWSMDHWLAKKERAALFETGPDAHKPA